MEGSNLSNGKDLLLKDLRILEEMAAEMKDYLVSSQLFWPKIDHKLVQPTIGGFRLRQHRLEALPDTWLSEEEQKRLSESIVLFDDACVDQSRDYELKFSRELAARLRQWAQVLEELLNDEAPSLAYYQTDVEVRAIIEVLVDYLPPRPTQEEEFDLAEIGVLDQKLKQRWESGEFIWPVVWQPAYPLPTYWWLYGWFKSPQR